MSRSKARSTPSRAAALDVLKQVRQGAFAENALSKRLTVDGTLKVEDRGLVTELVYGVLRWEKRLDAIIRRCSDFPQRRIRPWLLDIIRIGLYQLFMLERVPHYAAVDQAVAQARDLFGSKSAAFVNAVLREALRNAEEVDPRPTDEPVSLASYYSHPVWLVKRWLAELGPDETRRVLTYNNSRPPLIVRANRIKTNREDLKKLWQEHGIQARPVAALDDALEILVSSGPIESFPGYGEGLFLVQDSASQLIAPLIGAKAGERILDSCAAPGGKTSHLCALTNNEVRVVAVDTEAGRLAEMSDNLGRLGARCAGPVPGDASDAEWLKSLGPFDRALVDAPCTNLGVLRRNPEVKHRTGPRVPLLFHERQSQLLKAAAQALVTGGVVVYSVCTVSEEETVNVVNRFLRENPWFESVPIHDENLGIERFVGCDGFLRTFPPPQVCPLDGFFAAKLRKTSEPRSR